MTNKKMTMLDYINETSVIGKGNLLSREEIVSPLVKLFKEKRYRKIAIIASGSSNNAAAAARLYLEKRLKVDVKVVTPFTFEHYEHNLTEDTFVFGITQSGRSTNTISALEKVRGLGRQVIVLTGFPESEVKNHCDVVIDFKVGVETVGYVTKGYVTTVLFLILFALVASKKLGLITGEEAQRDSEQISEAFNVHPEVVKQSIDFYNKHKGIFTGMKRLQICGYGPNYGTALEGALKIGETFGIPATPYEIEEFMHGGYLELTPEHVVILVDSDGEGHERTMEVYSALQVTTKNVFLIGSTKLPDGDKVLGINHNVDEWFSPLFLVVFFQVLSYMICTDLDIWEKDEAIDQFESSINSKTPKPDYLK